MTASSLEIEFARPGFELSVRLEWDERVLVLFGPSGSGKSTLLECLLGLHPSASTRIRLDDRWLDDPERGLRTRIEERGLGWVPQAPTLFPHLDVAGNLAFGRRRAGAAADVSMQRAIEVLELGSLLERSVDELSGGERSRVALGRALASGPKALLLDEPLAALDLALRARVLPYLMRVRDELDLPLVYITHDSDEAMLIGDRVAVLDQGKLVEAGQPREVLWSRAVLPLSEALGMENLLEVRGSAPGDEPRVSTASGLELIVPWPVAGGERVSIGCPAHEILIALEEPRGISARNILPARILRVDEAEGDVLVHLDAGEPLVAKLTPGALHRLGLSPGTQVYAIIKAQALRRVR
ncbi:MAG: molybdenum ABC transporter ATP-binding protein [Myxococcota bacterium]|jgi:molybdate transport system ATP-binding protein|nr:molybdenum ABC transporter ATP-binding protein [Myxococcota bacterium]